jgi:tRNA dimethylallyltransferase
MSSLGYRQLVPYLRGDCTLDDAIERIRLDTHRYVRHQETWLRRNPRLNWIDVTSPNWVVQASDYVKAFLGARAGSAALDTS